MNENDILSGLSAEEQERLRKIEKLDSNQTRKKIIFATVTVFLIVLFVFGTIFGAKYILSYEGSEALPVEKLPDSDISAANFGSELAALVADAENYASVKADRRNSFSVPGESVTVESENEDAQSFFGFVLGSVTDKLSELYRKNDFDGTYGEDFSAKLPDLSAAFAGLGKTEITVNEENDAQLIAKISFEGIPFEKISSSPVMNLFGLEDAGQLRDEALALFTPAAQLSDVAIEYKELTITADISRTVNGGTEKRHLESLTFERKCAVSLTARFIGELEEYGVQKIGFEADISEQYRFTRVAFDISNDKYFIEKGDSDEINKKITSDEPVQQIKVEWSSSDEDVLTVDAKGFFKGKKVSDKPVTVTGKYTYNGVTYTDECLFYVRVPVEGVKLSEKQLELKVGEEKQIEPVIDPKDATFRDVYWFSTDENVAVVENGKVIAVGPGEAGIYIITFDGNFKKTCPVTVTQ